MALVLRPGAVDDIEPMFGLHCLVFRVHIDPLWGWDENWQRENFWREWASAPPDVVLWKGLRVGYLQAVVDQVRVRIGNIALHPDVQGKGIGTALIRSLQRDALRRGLPVSLRVFPTNTAALRLYARLGFGEVSRSTTAVELTWIAV
jgi:ribosomal protein S18 acetylase RimI-like enzyme